MGAAKRDHSPGEAMNLPVLFEKAPVQPADGVILAVRVIVTSLGPTKFVSADRKSTRLNSSHGYISYAVFCLKNTKRRTPGPPALLGGRAPTLAGDRQRAAVCGHRPPGRRLLDVQSLCSRHHDANLFSDVHRT